MRLLESASGRIHFPSEEYTCLDLAINLVVHILILILCLTPAMVHNLVGLFFEGFHSCRSLPSTGLQAPHRRRSRYMWLNVRWALNFSQFLSATKIFSDYISVFEAVPD